LSLDYDLIFSGDTADYGEALDIPKLSSFTMCVWLETQDANHQGTIFSYTVADQSNTLAVYDYKNVKLVINGETKRTDVSINDANWHHVCLTWHNNDGRCQLYIDGEQQTEASDFQTDATVDEGGTMILGKYQYFC
ncbi:neuronal pentraxin-2-like, partial [Saccoglossus kowalevskii]